MKEIEKLAHDIASEVSDDSGKYGSLLLVFTILGVIVNTLRLMESCNVFGQDIHNKVRNPGPIQKIAIKRNIRKDMSTATARLREDTFNKALSKLKQLTNEQIDTMIKEAKEHK